MSRLSEILGVKEGQEFKVSERGYLDTYKIDGERRMYKSLNGNWYECTNEKSLIDMILHKHLICPIPEKPQLTEHQITAIKGRIAEGMPWAARDRKGILFTYENKPKLSHDQTYFYSEGYGSPTKSDLYDFITFENSPVYLPELIGE